MKYEAVLFDFDGVIANTMKYHVQAWNQVFKQYNIDIQPEDIFFQEGRGAAKIAPKLAQQKGLNLPSAELEALTAKKRKIYNDITKASVYPETEALVSRLKEMSVKIGLVTGSIIPNMIVVTGEEFLKNFEIIITGDSVNENKPHPEPYLAAAEKLDVKPEQCIVIENAPLGIQAAKAAGMFCIAVKTTIKNEELLKKADLIVEHISDITIEKILSSD